MTDLNHNHLFVVEDGTSWWIVAETSAAALRHFVDYHYSSMSLEAYAAECPGTTVQQVPDERTMTVRFESHEDEDDEVEQTLTAREWAAQSEPGLLCSSEW